MADAKALVKDYLQGNTRAMQIATVKGGKPWVATVYFVVDNDLNIYWLSWPERRHSQELTVQSDIAGTVVIKTDQPVVGVQFAGHAVEVTDSSIVQDVMKLYVAKYSTGEGFSDAFAVGTNRHCMYRLVPTELSLFDELHFPGISPVTI